ncbi:MAG: V-type ATPase subunit [Candidatus Micrarchaeota archaeon]|nr:V-type ATPase subunit [Candidatus Micrarchaeota archaeon]MDE1824158.1 V-type ATPase subunit [Candidatus Micrarchaeota archaeon]MDE1849407.1 V-type ATPase subunit [Candidatus Micrarchaeota archaeon]
MLFGESAARHFGYSSARVRVMKSRLLSKKTIDDVVSAKDISSVISILFNSDYKHEIEEFGGQEIKNERIDFALSKNMAKQLTKLIEISPSTERKITRTIVGKWALYNIKLAMEAKDKKQGFDSIARYVVDVGKYNSSVIKEAMREESIEGLLNKLMINSPYYGILKDAQEAYKSTKSAPEAIATIDKSYYKEMQSVIFSLRTVSNEAALLLKMEIDSKNVLTLIRAKRFGAKFSEVSSLLIDRGTMTRSMLENAYTNSKDVEAFASQLKGLHLKEASDEYKNSKHKQLLTFEIAMKNSIFNDALRLLSHSILSFGTILAYAYMKEIEIYTLRILINSRLYGLDKEETAKLISWRKS